MLHTPITAQPSQLEKLDTLIAKLTAARGDAIKGELFASTAGYAAVNAAFDLFEVDGLYDLALDALTSTTEAPTDWYYETQQFRAAPFVGMPL